MITDEDREALVMTLAVAYYTPLGWALEDGDDVDPEDLAECLKAMAPVAEAVERIVARHVAAALAKVEALADEWEMRRYGEQMIPPAVLRAALADARDGGAGDE